MKAYDHKDLGGLPLRAELPTDAHVDAHLLRAVHRAGRGRGLDVRGRRAPRRLLFQRADHHRRGDHHLQHAGAADRGRRGRRRGHARLGGADRFAALHDAAPQGGLPRRPLLRRVRVSALLLLGVPIGLLLSTMLPGIEPQILGPFRAEAYLTSYFFFALPNAFVATAVLFSLAAISRRAITAYAGAAFLFFSALLSETFLAARLGNWGLGKLLDPLAYTTLRELWKSSNPIQRKTLLIGMDGALLSNRLLWVGLALTVLLFAYARFRFAYHTGGGGWRHAKQIDDDAPVTRWTGIAVPDARRAFGLATRMRQLRGIAMRSFRELVTSRGWLIVPLVAVLFIVTAPELLEVDLGTPGAATTGRVASLYGPDELGNLIALLIVLSAGVLVWRERDARMDAIADVAPVPEWLTFLGKFLALGLMLAAAHAIFVAGGMVVQLTQGNAPIDFGLWIKFIFGFQLTGYLLFAALAMVIHVLVNQKYVGNVLAFLAFIGSDLARELGVRHNLLLFGGAPEWSYSEMAGFGPQVGPWLWFKFYWAGWVLLFAVLTYLFWIRGEERGVRTRIALARRRLTRGPAVFGAIALAIILGAGGFAFYNTNVLHRFISDADVEQSRAEYERRYSKYAATPQPILAATKLHVDFYPERGAATIRGSNRLENRSGVPIDAIHVVPHLSVKTTVSFDHPSRLTLADDNLGFRLRARQARAAGRVGADGFPGRLRAARIHE